MLTFGVVSPHPPLIIPEIGGKDIEKVRKTTAALEAAAKKLAATKPERIVIISPHTDHGYEVPLYYLGKELAPAIEVEKILVTNPSYEYYYRAGETVRQRNRKNR